MTPIIIKKIGKNVLYIIDSYSPKGWGFMVEAASSGLTDYPIVYDNIEIPRVAYDYPERLTKKVREAFNKKMLSVYKLNNLI